MSNLINKFSVRIFLTIFVLCLFWIIGTDFFVYQFDFSASQLLLVNIGKGILFVFFVSVYVAYAYENEKRLLEQKEFDYSRFFVNSPEPMFICLVDDLIIIDLNHAAESFFGTNNLSLKGTSVKNFVFEADRLEKITRDFDPNEMIDTGLYQIKHANRAEAYVTLTFYGVNFRGQSCFLVKLVDQTDYLEAQEVASLNTKLITLGELSANIAHEVKNPLTIIYLAMSKIRIQFSSHQAPVHELNAVDAALARIEATVTSLQRISRNEFFDKKAPLILDRLVNDSLILSRDTIIQKNVEVTVSVEACEGLIGHEAELMQVLINLIKNALDSMENSKSTNWINISTIKGENTIQLRVMNSGSVIPESIRSKIFNRFFTTKDPGKGTGLGLSFSKRILQRNGGKIFLDHSAAHTTFVLELPLTNEKEDQLKH
jgi:signal transduction histidine kinase